MASFNVKTQIFSFRSFSDYFLTTRFESLKNSWSGANSVSSPIPDQLIVAPHLSLFSTSVTSRSTVSLASSASELHTDRLLITFSRRYPTIHWAPSVSAPNAVLRGMLIWGETGEREGLSWLREDVMVNGVVVSYGGTRGERRAHLLIQLLVHQQVRLRPPPEEPHDVLSHLRAQQLCQARSRCAGLNLRRPQHRWEQPVTGEITIQFNKCH